MEKIVLTRDDLYRGIFADAVFMMFAEAGAMGECGAVRFFTRDRKYYVLNYLYGDVELADICRHFPVLEQCRFGMFGKGSVVPVGWHYLYMGMGQHLLVEESVYPEFCEQTIDCQYANEIAAQWPRFADTILAYEYE